eukprot:694751-Hanusia_phi.AAC.1
MQGQAVSCQQAVQIFTAREHLHNRHLDVSEQISADGCVRPVRRVDDGAIEAALPVGAEVRAEEEVLEEDKGSGQISLKDALLVYHHHQHMIHRSEHPPAPRQHLGCTRTAVQDRSRAQRLMCPGDGRRVAVPQVLAVLEASLKVEEVGRRRERSSNHEVVFEHQEPLVPLRQAEAQRSPVRHGACQAPQPEPPAPLDPSDLVVTFEEVPDLLRPFARHLLSRYRLQDMHLDEPERSQHAHGVQPPVAPASEVEDKDRNLLVGGRQRARAEARYGRELKRHGPSIRGNHNPLTPGVRLDVPYILVICTCNDAMKEEHEL